LVSDSKDHGNIPGALEIADSFVTYLQRPPYLYVS